MQEFIRKHGVTVCPPVGSKELAALSIKREKASEARRNQSWGWRAF